MDMRRLLTVTMVMCLWMGVNARSLPESQSPNKTLTLGFLFPAIYVGKYASAVIPALQEGARRQLLNGYEINWIWRDSACNANKGEQRL